MKKVYFLKGFEGCCDVYYTTRNTIASMYAVQGGAVEVQYFNNRADAEKVAKEVWEREGIYVGVNEKYL